MRYEKHHRRRGNATVYHRRWPSSRKTGYRRSRRAGSSASCIRPPAGKEDRSSRPKTSPRRTPERHCLATPPAADGQTQRDRNPLVGNHVQPGPQAVSTLSWRGSNMRAEGGRECGRWHRSGLGAGNATRRSPRERQQTPEIQRKDCPPAPRTLKRGVPRDWEYCAGFFPPRDRPLVREESE